MNRCKVLIILLFFAIIFPYTCVLTAKTDKTSEYIDFLRKNKEFTDLYFSNIKGEIIPFKDAGDYIRKLIFFMDKKALPEGLNKKRAIKKFPDIFGEIRGKTGTILPFKLTFFWWGWQLTINNRDTFSGILQYNYQLKLLLFPIKRLYLVAGERDSPPEISHWIAPELRLYLKKYFSEENMKGSSYVKKLAYLFELISQNQKIGMKYSYLSGKSFEEKKYIKKLIKFMNVKKSGIGFEDYLCIIYPFNYTVSKAPLFFTLPFWEPKDFLIKFNIGSIKTVGVSTKMDFFSNFSQSAYLKSEFETFRKVLSEELLPEQAPYIIPFLICAKIKIKVETIDNKSFIIGINRVKRGMRYIRYWGRFFPNERKWLFYEIKNTPKHIRIFDKIYSNLLDKKLNSSERRKKNIK